MGQFIIFQNTVVYVFWRSDFLFQLEGCPSEGVASSLLLPAVWCACLRPRHGASVPRHVGPLRPRRGSRPHLPQELDSSRSSLTANMICRCLRGDLKWKLSLVHHVSSIKSNLAVNAQQIRASCCSRQNINTAKNSCFNFKTKLAEKVPKYT